MAERPSNPMVPPLAPEAMKPVNRYITFLVGIGFTFLMFTIAKWQISKWLDFNWAMSLGLFLTAFVVCFVAGIVKVAGKDASGKDIEAGFEGVVKILDAPLPKWCRFLLPTGRSWILPFFMEVDPVDVREQAFSIPPEENVPGFEVQSLSLVNPKKPKAGTKYVPMHVKARIRYKVINPYLWYMQDRKTIERTLVMTVVETLRYIAANGNYPGERDLPIKSDFEFMMKRHELGEALTQDIKELSGRQWGLQVIDVIIRKLQPADPVLIQRYLQVAKEIADREAQTLEGQHILRLAKQYQAEDKSLTREQALMYAMLSAGKTTLDNLKILGGSNAMIFRQDKGQVPRSPSE